MKRGKSVDFTGNGPLDTIPNVIPQGQRNGLSVKGGR
jgi:hypothetical protein